ETLSSNRGHVQLRTRETLGGVNGEITTAQCAARPLARRRRSTPRPRAPRSRAGHVADFAGPEATAHPPDLRWNTSLLGVGSAESPPSPVLPGAFGAPPSLESVSPAPPAPSSSPAAPSGAPPSPCPGSPPAP